MVLVSAASLRGGAAWAHRRLGEFPFEQAQAPSSTRGLLHRTQNLEEILLVRHKAPPQARASARGRWRQRCPKEGAQLLCRRLVVEHGAELPSQLRGGTTRKARRELRPMLPRPHEQGEQEAVLRKTLFEGAIAGRGAQLVFYGRRQHSPNSAGSHAAAFFTCTEEQRLGPPNKSLLSEKHPVDMGDAERLEKTANSLAKCVRTLNIRSDDLANLRQDIVHRRRLRPYETAAMLGAPASEGARKLKARDVKTCVNLMLKLAGTEPHVKDSEDLWRRVAQLVSSPAPPPDLPRAGGLQPEPPSADERPASGEMAAEGAAEAEAGSPPAHAHPVGEGGPPTDDEAPHAPAAGARHAAPGGVASDVKELADCIRILDVPEGHLLALQHDVDLGSPLERYAVTALRDAYPSAAKTKVVRDCLELLRSARVKRRPDLWHWAAEERKVMALADCIRTLRVQPNRLSDLRHDVERGRSLEAFRAAAMRGALHSGERRRLRAKAVGDCLTKLQTQFAHAHEDTWVRAGRLAFPAPMHPAPPPPPSPGPAPDDVDEPPPPGAALSTAQDLKRESASLQATLKWKPPTVPVLSAPPPKREGALDTFRHPWPLVHGRRPASSWTGGAFHETLPRAVAADICRAAGRAVHLEGWASFKARMGRTSHLIAGISNEMRVVEEGVYFPPGVLAETAAWRFLRRSAPQDPHTHPLATEEIQYVAHRVDDRAMGQRSLEAFALRFVQGTLLFHELGQCFLAPLVVGWGFEHAARTSRPHVVGDAPRKILEEPFAKGGRGGRRRCSRAEDCVGALCELSGKRITQKKDAVCANGRCYLRDALRAHCASQAGRPFLRASAPAGPLTGSHAHESWSERLRGNAAELISSILREDAAENERGPYLHRDEEADDRAEQDKVAGRRQREEPASDDMEAALLAALQSDDDDVEERSAGSELDAHAVAAAGDPAAERGDKPEAIVQELLRRSGGHPDEVLRRLGVVADDEASVPDADDPEKEHLKAELAELPPPRPVGAQPLDLAAARARAYRFRKFLRHAATARAARIIDREKDAAILHALGARSTQALKNALVASWADRRRGRTEEGKSARIVREARRAGGNLEADDASSAPPGHRIRWDLLGTGRFRGAPPPVHAGIGRALGIVQDLLREAGGDPAAAMEILGLGGLAPEQLTPLEEQLRSFGPAPKTPARREEKVRRELLAISFLHNAAELYERAARNDAAEQRRLRLQGAAQNRKRMGVLSETGRFGNLTQPEAAYKALRPPPVSLRGLRARIHANGGDDPQGEEELPARIDKLRKDMASFPLTDEARKENEAVLEQMEQRANTGQRLERLHQEANAAHGEARSEAFADLLFALAGSQAHTAARVWKSLLEESRKIALEDALRVGGFSGAGALLAAAHVVGAGAETLREIDEEACGPSVSRETCAEKASKLLAKDPGTAVPRPEEGAPRRVLMLLGDEDPSEAALQRVDAAIAAIATPPGPSAPRLRAERYMDVVDALMLALFEAHRGGRLRRGHQRHKTPTGTHDGLLLSGEVAAFLRRERGRNPPWELLPASESERVCRLPDGSWYRPDDESLLGRGPVGARGDDNRPRREPAGARDDDSQTSDEAPWEPPDFLSEKSEEELPEGEMATDELRGWKLLASTHQISLAHDLFLRSLREHAVAVPPAAFAHAMARTVIHLAAAGVFFLGLSATDFSWTESRERVVLSRTDLPFVLRRENAGTDTWDAMAALCMLDSIFLRAYLDWRYLIAELVTHAQPGAEAPAKQTPDAARLLIATRALLTSGSASTRGQAAAAFRDRVMQDLRPTLGVNEEQRDGGEFFTVLGSQILGTWEEGAHKISAAIQTGTPEGAVRRWDMHRRDRDSAIHAWKRRMQSVVDRDSGAEGEIPAWVLPVDTDHETEPNVSSRMLVRWRPSSSSTPVAESHRFGEDPPLPRGEKHRYPGIVTLELTPSQGEKKTRPRREGHNAGEVDSSSGSSESEDGEHARQVTSEGDIRTLAYEVRALLRRQGRLPGEETPFITLPGGERRPLDPRDWLGTTDANIQTRGGGKLPERPTLRWRPWRMAAPVQLSLNLLLHVAHELYAPGSRAMESLLRHEMPWPEPALPSLTLSPFDAEHSQDGCHVEACASSAVWNGTVPRGCVALPAHPRDSTCLRPGWALRTFVLYLPVPAEASKQRPQEDVPPPPPPPRAVGQGRHDLLQGYVYVSPEQLPSALPLAAPPPTVSAADAGGRGLLAATRRAFVAQVIMLDLLFLLHASSESLSAGTLASGQRVVVQHPDLAARDGAPDQGATVVEALPGAAGLGRRYRVRLEPTTAARELELSAMIRRAHLADRGHPADAFKGRRDAIVFRSALREDPRGAVAAKEALDHFLERRSNELEDFAQGERRPSASEVSILAAVVQGRSPEVLAPFCAAAASAYAETMETLRAAASTAARPSDSPTAGAARELATFLRHPVLTFDHETSPQDLPLFLTWASRLFGPTWQQF